MDDDAMSLSTCDGNWVGKKHPYYGKGMIINFSDFPYCGKFIETPMHLPYAEVYHRMGIGWEESTHTVGKVWLSISQSFRINWVFLHFPVLWEIYEETHAFPIWWIKSMIIPKNAWIKWNETTTLPRFNIWESICNWFLQNKPLNNLTTF